MINRNENGEISVGAPGSPARTARTPGLVEVRTGRASSGYDQLDIFAQLPSASNLHTHIATVASYPTVGTASGNAAHLVACWNALEGWNPAYVREFLESARKMVRDHMTPAEWVELSKLLAKADGRIG